MKMKKNKVEFVPSNRDTEDMLPHPKPSKNFIPKWFKDMPSEVQSTTEDGFIGTAKMCMPFLDTFVSGYTQELICDINIINNGIDENGKDIISYNWSGPIRPFSTRLEDRNAPNVFPNFDGYYNTEFHWISKWEPRTPPGYSTFYYHPANRFDLPFQTFNGIIDTDKWSISGPVPFLIKKGFEGVIPAGTPIYQMIFIKRDEWTSEPVPFDEKFQKSHLYNVRSIFKDGYKKKYWSKKGYH
jgi:hypothetical protein